MISVVFTQIVRNLLILVLVLLFSSYNAVHSHGFEILEVFENDSSPAEARLHPQQPNFLLEIELSTCTCRDDKSECGIGIAKSTVLEIPCQPNELYCCSGRQEPAFSSSLLPNSSDAGEENSRSFHSVITSYSDQLLDPTSPMNNRDDEEENDDDLLSLDDSDPDYVPIDKTDTPPNHRIVPILQTEPLLPFDSLEEFSSSSSTLRPNMQCRCKHFDSCPQKYLDLRYQVTNCPFNTTRCCEPEVGAKETFTAQDVSSRRHDEEEEEEKNGQKTCVCLPRTQCGRGDLMDWRLEEGQPCPGGLAQCCREGDDPTASDSSPPIPLPEVKIPLTEEITSYDDNRDQPVVQSPVLPIYYDYHGQGKHSGYYYPPQARPQPQWNDYQQYNRAPPVELPRAINSNSDSLFNKIAKIIG